MAAPKVLMLTNIERGEANIFLAVSRAMLASNPEVEIHLASFPGLEKDAAAISEDARKANPDADTKPIAYHTIKGPSMEEGITAIFHEKGAVDEGEYLPRSFMKPLSFGVTKQTLSDVAPIFVPYSGSQLVDVYNSIVEIIGQVKPDLVVVDSLMTAGLTACWYAGVNFTCLSPNSFKEFAAPLQSRAANLWKYPALMSGYPFPVPWHLIPANIYLSIYAIIQLIKDKSRVASTKHFEETIGQKLRTPVDLLRNRPESLKILVASLPELDFPLQMLPSHLVACGPIIRPAPAIADSSPELATWLARGPTIYINLGSICKVSETQAVEMAGAIKKTLDALDSQATGDGAQKHQVLWKLQKSGEYKTTDSGSAIHNVVGAEIGADRVRIVSWVDAVPFSILESGHVACSVHHGGANSFNEAVLAGVPQVVLPQWTDCYDYSRRVELLGIGRLGAHKQKPRWQADELSTELLAVLSGDGAETMKTKAKEVAAATRQHGDGATTAARLIMEQIKAPEATANGTAEDKV